MKYCGEVLKSPARKAIDICWSKCLPKYRHKYLQGTEILGLIRELETFFGIRELLKPDEEALLRKTLKSKPQLRLFKGECSSFILGLVHFSSVEEFLETRFRISSKRLRELVETYSDNILRSPELDISRWGDESKSAGTYGTYGKKPADFVKAEDRKPFPSNTQDTGSWYSKWARDPYIIDSKAKADMLRKETQETWFPRWFENARKFVSETFVSRGKTEDNLRDNPTTSHPFKAETAPYARKFDVLDESLADLRLHTQKLDTEKSIYQSLDELQAAVRDQARVISRLENERGRNFKTRAPGYISQMYVPWDYFTGFVTTFVRDLADELLPKNKKRTIPDFVVRVLSLVLGYFVIINFFRLVYFLAVLTMYSSETALPYIFSNEDPRESAPLTWLQEYPALEYWAYSLRDWTGY